MNRIPQPIKTKLAELATFPEKYTLVELETELQLMLVLIKNALDAELTQPALKRPLLSRKLRDTLGRIRR